MRTINFLTCVVLLIFLGTLLSAKKMFELDIEFSIPVLAEVNKERVYIYDAKSQEIFVFSKKQSPHLIMKFGSRGAGPSEFRGITFVKEYRDYIHVSSSGKISYFSLDGKLIKEKRVEYATCTYIPLGRNFACEKYQGKFLIAKIYNSNLEEKKSHLETFEFKNYYKTFTNNKPNSHVIKDFLGYVVDNDQLYIGNTQKGFYFSVFDENGGKLYEINRPYKKHEINHEAKEEIMKCLIALVGEQRILKRRKKVNFVYPKYYPSYLNFTVNDGMFYVMTYPIKDGRVDIMVLDKKGTLLKRTSVPARLYLEHLCIFDGNYYYITENEEPEKWELHEIPINKELFNDIGSFT